MHKASTENIDSRIRECAIKLCDTSLLAKLATPDMHALDAQYHRKCLTSLYNSIAGMMLVFQAKLWGAVCVKIERYKIVHIYLQNALFSCDL